MKANDEKLYKLLYGNFVHKDWQRLTGVYHSNGFIYASNGYIVAKIDRGYPDDKESKSIDRFGNLIQAAGYESVLTKNNEYVKMNLDVDRLRVAAKKVYKLKNTFIDLGLRPVEHKGYEKIITFRSDLLEAAFKLFELLHERFEVYMRNVSSIECGRLILKSIDSNTVVEISIVLSKTESRDGVFTIEEAVNYEKVTA